MNAGKLKSALRLVTTFLAGHGALQGLNIITGLFLIRALSIEAYAQYSLAMAFQVTAISLTNLGLTDTIIPLVGSRGKDLAIVGKYVRAARALRTRLFLVVGPCCAAAFYALVRSHHWSSASFAVLLISLLASLYWSVSIACWSAPLILNHRLSDYYLGQLAATAATSGDLRRGKRWLRAERRIRRRGNGRQSATQWCYRQATGRPLR